MTLKEQNKVVMINLKRVYDATVSWAGQPGDNFFIALFDSINSSIYTTIQTTGYIPGNLARSLMASTEFTKIIDIYTYMCHNSEDRHDVIQGLLQTAVTLYSVHQDADFYTIYHDNFGPYIVEMIYFQKLSQTNQIYLYSAGDIIRLHKDISYE